MSLHYLLGMFSLRAIMIQTMPFVHPSGLRSLKTTALGNLRALRFVLMIWGAVGVHTIARTQSP